VIKTYERYSVTTHDQLTGKVNGKLISVWKHYEGQRELPPMEAYVTSFLPGVIKGPHLHKTRWDYFTCVKGKVLIIVKDHNGKYHETVSSEDKPITVEVPANVPSASINLSNETSLMLNLCNPAWHPENEDNYDVEFKDYDFDAARKRYINESV
jgi:dTDP-4-dehydrorhamnose 3,5-epimerase-like enzyme